MSVKKEHLQPPIGANRFVHTTLKPPKGLDDQPGALDVGEPRHIQHDIKIAGVVGILHEMIFQEVNPLPINRSDLVRRFACGDIPLPA